MTTALGYLVMSAAVLLLIPAALAAREAVLLLLRGALNGTAEVAASRLGRFPPWMPRLDFFGQRVPLKVAFTHFFLQGVTGSGKSVITLLFIKSVVQLINAACHARGLAARSGHAFLSLFSAGSVPLVRLVALDSKGDILPAVAKMVGPGVPGYLLQPFDARTVCWVPGVDYSTPVELEQLAATLVAKEAKGHQDPYWPNAAREVLFAVLLTFLLYANNVWTWRDLLCATRKRRRTRAILLGNPYTRDIADQHLSVAKTASGVITTIGSNLASLASAAACFDRSQDRPFAIRPFLDQPGVLILGWDDRIPEVLRPLIGLFLRRLSDLLLQRLDPSKPTVLAIDELPILARFASDSLRSLAPKGRASGAILLATVQDILQLEAAWGEKEARAFAGSLLTRGILRTESDEGSRFASALLGDAEGKPYVPGHAWEKGGIAATRAEAVGIKPLVTPGQVKSLPVPDGVNATAYGFVQSWATGTFPATVSFAGQLGQPGGGPDIPGFVPRDPADQILRPWTTDDIDRLGLPNRDEIASTL